MRKTALLLLVVALLFPFPSFSTLAFAQAGAKPAPATQKPAPSTTKKPPATAKPAPSAKPAAPTAKPAPPPPPPPPSDVRFKSKYTTGDQVTESVTYVSGARERYDLGNMILLRQHDLKRSVQISVDAKTYLIAPDVESAAAPPPTGTGVVLVTTTINDVGERKTMFGQEARRVATVLDRQPQAGACDQMKQKVETVGWYIDPPKAMAAQPPAPIPSVAGSCHDEVKVSRTGDETLIGFPISYTTTLPGTTDDKPVVMQMEVTEFEITKLDAALFEIPEGMTEVTSGKDLVKAVSDANEVKLAAPPDEAVPPKKAGVVRVGVPELLNKTTQEVDTRALRTQLIAELAEQKVEGMPLAAAPQAELDAQAKALGADYLLIAQITELKASKPGGLGRLVRKTAGESSDKDVTEAKLNVQLVPVGAAKPKMSTTTDGKDGGMGFKTGLRLARAAAMMYLRYASPLSSMNSMAMMNMGGMSALGNPGLMQMQGAGVMGTGRGLDRTAGAAMYMMDAMATGSSAGMGGGPSFDASLAEAIEGAAEKTRENVNRK